MPAPGDQHASWPNPYDEPKTRVSSWSAKEIATIASKLDKQLGPEYISSRAGPGGSRVHYLTAEKCIGLANQVFGFNGWSSSIKNIQVDFADENPQTQRVSIGLSVIVRVTLRDGTYHEDIGYGSIDNVRGKATAFEKAKKEGTTDGLKRALRNFGNVLGNCIYDQDYVKRVTKVKAQPVKAFDQEGLHRHADFVKQDEVVKIEPACNPVVVAPPKLNSAESFDDFFGDIDEADFSDPMAGHPDDMTLPQLDTTQAKPQDQITPLSISNANGIAPTDANHLHTPQGPPTKDSSSAAQSAGQQQHLPAVAQSRDLAGPAPHPGPPQAQSHDPLISPEPVAFLSVRTLHTDSDGNVPKRAQATERLFNPQEESPSIRKTPGIDHNSSRPLARLGQVVQPHANRPSPAAAAPGSSTPSCQAVNPNSALRSGGTVPDRAHRRVIGAPGGPGSPLANRGSYKPPTMKRPLPNEGAQPPAAATKRSPLVDVAVNISAVTGGGGSGAEGVDLKRQRTTALY